MTIHSLCKVSGGNRQRGVSLVESLVALVVLSIGMLGIASLYVASLKANRTALVRTQAVNLASDIADRIRANRRGQGAYATGNAPPVGEDEEPEDPKTCLGETCTASELAAADLERWRASIAQTMPGGSIGTVRYDGAPDGSGAPNRYTITVQWPESDEGLSQTRLVLEL